jgi:hypothetical protein
MRALGTRSIAAVVLLAGAGYGLGKAGLYRADYWAQLSPWVAFAAAAFAVLAGTLVLQFWRIGETSEYYVRFGERLPFAAETALGPGRGRTLLLGHAAQVEVIDFPPVVQRAMFLAVFLAIGLVTVDNRAIELLRGVPDAFDRDAADFCDPPAPPKLDQAVRPGCKLVERAYKLGYTKSLGSCAPKAEEAATPTEVCRRRQHDEPYLHYAWRLLDTRVGDAIAGDGEPGMIDRFERQKDHLPAMFAATLDSIAMEPRSSHHVFTNLPDPRPSLGDRVERMLEHGCGARLARMPHWATMADSPAGPSLLVEHVLDQLLLNPLYRPIVATCEEIVVHWNAPVDACARLAADPRGVLDGVDALDGVTGMLARRSRKIELTALEPVPAPEAVAPAARVVSLQCLMFDEAAAPGPVVERPAVIDGETFVVREARTAPLAADGASQVRLYKAAAALLAPGFGYGRLTSNQAFGVRPEEATLAATFKDPQFLLTKLDLLRDADLFLGNEWLGDRPDLLAVYPYHVHLQTFVEVFRRQYREHRGRL